jgi:hypothetical protein
MSSCAHNKAIVVRSGSLMPEAKRMPFEAAWCPECGAFREDSATKDPNPYQSPANIEQEVPDDEAIW